VVAISISEGYAASLRVKRQLVPREFQNINIENYLKNERAVRFQLKCIIDDGPCDRIGKYLKVTIPELLVNQCANCDSAQRERAGKLVSHIQQNFPEDWERAVKKFQSHQGGLVKPEDAAKLETLLGVKLDPKLVGAASTTTAAPESTPVAKAAEVPSTSEIPISSSAAPAAPSSSEAPASSSAAPAAVAVPEATSAASVAPVESTSIAAAVSEASSTAAAVSSTSESAAVVSTSEAAAPASSTAAAVAPAAVAAPVA